MSIETSKHQIKCHPSYVKKVLIGTRLGVILSIKLLSHCTLIYNTSIGNTFMMLEYVVDFCEFDQTIISSYLIIVTRKVLDFEAILGMVHF